MSINLGDFNNNDDAQENYGGLKLNKVKSTIPLAPKSTSSEKSKKKKGYHIGDGTKAFLSEAGKGFNNFIKLPGRTVNVAKNVINESEAMKDGYDPGDISKTLISTGLSTAQNFGEGVIRGGEQLIDAGANLFGGASDWVNTKAEKMAGMHKGKSESEINKAKGDARKKMISTDYTSELMEAVGKDDEYKNMVEANSIVKSDNFGGMAARELGRQALNLVLANGIGGSNKIAQSMPLATSAYGGGVEEAYQNGASWGEANRYGLLNSATETITEWMFDGIPGMKGSKGKGIDYFAEKYLFHEPLEKSSKTLSKALLKSGYKLVGENTEEVLSDLINPYLKQFTYEYNSNKDILGNINEASSKLPTMQDLLQTIIVTSLTTGILEAPSNISDVAGTLKKNKTNLTNTATDLSNLTADNINNQSQEKVSVNGLKLNQNDMYQYMPSENIKIDNFRKNVATLNWNNSDQTNNFVNMLEKIINDKDVDIRFDNNLTDEQGRIANGKYENGVITINPNSNRAGEFIAIHELTHAIGTDSMKNIVENYRRSNKEFDTAINELLSKTYNTNELTEEAMADVAGQLFGNQEFINNLSKTNPSLFKKIYNEIKYLWHQFTGYKNQNQFIEDLQYKWEQAYRSNNELNNSNSYLKGKLSNGEDVVISDDKNGSHPSKIQAQTSLESMLGIKYNNESSNQVLEITNKDIKKYLNDGYNNNKNMNLKKRISGNYGEILEISKINPDKSQSNYKGSNRGKNGFDYYDVNLAYPVKDINGKVINHRYYDARLVVRKENDGNFAYDLDNFKEKKGIVLDEKTSSIVAEKSADDSFNVDNISQNDKNVKSDALSTKYSIQETENNTQKLEQRVSGDELLDAQDLIDEVKSVGAEVDDNGYVTVYHQTTPEAAQKIKETGKMISKELDVFFSTSKNATQSEGRGQVKLEFKIPAEKLKLDDVFDDNIDVKIPLNGKKELDVSNYLTNRDLRYSKKNATWQEYLESNFKSKGTKTNLKKLNVAPIEKKESSNIQENTIRKIDTEVKKQTPIKEINKQKIENNDNAIKRLTQEKDALTERLKSKIKEKQDLLKSKTNKDSKFATQLNIQISNLNNQLQNRQLDYDHRIDYYKNRNDKMNSEEFKTQEQRMTKKQEYLDQAYDLTENMVDWKDKNKGISYQINTMKRNLHDIMSNPEADKMYNTYFQPITENNAKSEKFINSYNERIKKFNLNNKESQAVQMLGEYKYNKDTLVTGMEVDDFITKNKLDYKKLNEAVEEFRNIYDELIVETNKVLKEQGYKEIEYRKGYFPHFQEETKPGKFAKLAEKFGFNVNKNDSLPTDIAGMTEIFRPGKTYFKNAQRRLGKITDYNALKGYDNYIRGAADIIFHTEDIQKLRALETVIRTQYTDNSIKETIEKISSNPDYDSDQKQALIDLEYAKINNPLPNFVTELRNYTDSLANKKDIGDRGMEHMMGRETYTIMKNVQSRVSANMVGFNISSALTNFIPITQAWGEISTKNMAKAIKQSIANQFKNDGFADASTYLINRTQQAERLYQTGVDKINSKAGGIFEAVDSITSNVIVRGKYLDNIDKGMTETEAMKNANEFAKDIMAGRSKGDMPTILNRKSPMIKLLTAFQLEVNNQYGYMLKDLPRNLSDEAKKKLAMAFLKMFVGAWLYNKFSESVTGRKSAFSPIDIVSDSVKTISNDNISSYDKISGTFKDITQDVPFIGGLMGGGRLPINAALPDIGISIKSATELSDNKKRSTAIKNLTKELEKPLFYVAMPFGGGQLKKTIEGASMYTHKIPGSYTSSGKLRFEAPKSSSGITKSLIFGQYSSKQAREYFDNGYAPLSEKQIDDWKEANVSLKEYRQYRSDYKKLNSIKGDKDENGKTIKGTATGKKAYNIINDEKLSDKEKNYLLKSITSSEKYTVTTKELEKIANDEEVYKYFYSLTPDNKKEFIKAIEKQGFDSYQLYDYYQARKHYDKYTGAYAKQALLDYLTTTDLTDDQKYYLYSKDYSSDDTIKLLKQFNVGANNYLNTVKYINDIKSDYPGNRYTNYRRSLTQKYIQGLNAPVLEKVILYKEAGYSISNYKQAMYDYIEKLPLSAKEKKKIWKQLY